MSKVVLDVQYPKGSQFIGRVDVYRGAGAREDGTPIAGDPVDTKWTSAGSGDARALAWATAVELGGRVVTRLWYPGNEGTNYSPLRLATETSQMVIVG